MASCARLLLQSLDSVPAASTVTLERELVNSLKLPGDVAHAAVVVSRLTATAIAAMIEQPGVILQAESLKARSVLSTMKFWARQPDWISHENLSSGQGMKRPYDSYLSDSEEGERIECSKDEYERITDDSDSGDDITTQGHGEEVIMLSDVRDKNNNEASDTRQIVVTDEEAKAQDVSEIKMQLSQVQAVVMTMAESRKAGMSKKKRKKQRSEDVSVIPVVENVGGGKITNQPEREKPILTDLFDPNRS